MSWDPVTLEDFQDDAERWVLSGWKGFPVVSDVPVVQVIGTLVLEVRALRRELEERWDNESVL